MDFVELGQTFRLARLEAKKTQQQIADGEGVTRTRIRRFEAGMLLELRVIEMLSLFEAVGLELYARPIGHGRTLDDVLAEQRNLVFSETTSRRRVRAARSATEVKATRKSR